MKFKIISFNQIKNHIFRFHSKSYLSMKFKIISFNYIQNLIFQSHSKSYLSMKFKKKINKTVFYSAIEKENIEIIKLLLSNDKIDVNIPYI